MAEEIALFCILYSASPVKRDHVISLLSKIGPYYRKPASNCTTWSYFVPSLRRGAPSQMVKAEGPNARLTLVAGIEIYKSKSALQAQIDDKEYLQPYYKTIHKENLYSKPENLVAWYPTGGFMIRNYDSESYEKDAVVVVAKITLKRGTRVEFLSIWGAFVQWCQANETNTLSYALFTRPKAADEVLIVERYKSSDDFEAHRKSLRFQEASKLAKPLIQSYVLDEWDEIDGSFAGSNDGEGHGTHKVHKL